MSQYFRPDAGANRTQTSGLLQIPSPPNNMALGSGQLRLSFLHIFALCRIEECMVLITSYVLLIRLQLGL